MSILFGPAKIKNMEIRNRFVRSATGDGAAERTGHISERQIELLSELAEGGVGLIITGITSVHPSGHISFSQSSIATDEYIPNFKKLSTSVHERGAKIVVQLFHGGREASRLRNLINEEAIAPSVVSDDHYKGKYRCMTEPEIWTLIQAFGDAAKGQKRLGLTPFRSMVPTDIFSANFSLLIQIAAATSGEASWKIAFGSTVKFTWIFVERLARTILCS